MEEIMKEQESKVDKKVSREAEVLQINVDFNCDAQCEKCERFFECKSEKKLKIFDKRRMRRALENMKTVRYKVAFSAGKGGVGKSLLTSNVAAALAMKGYKVTILDQDFDGSCIPKMFGVTDQKLRMTTKGITPVKGHLGVEIAALGLIVPDDEVVTWYHNLRRNATEEFLSNVIYGERDFLLIDLPPGTSSDAINLMQYIPDLNGMCIVTNATQVSQIVAKKTGILSLKSGVEVIGVIENMAGFVCPHCGEVLNVMKWGGGEEMAKRIDVPFLGRIPLDMNISKSSDIGRPYVMDYPESPAAKETVDITERIVEFVKAQEKQRSQMATES
jgi:ATP-binding protein involved in chromosome partitioning